MATGAHQILFRTRIDDALSHRVEMRFDGIVMTVNAQLLNIGSFEQGAVVRSVRLMAGSAIIEGRFVPDRTGELGIVVAIQTGFDAFAAHESGAITHVRAVAVDAASLALDRRMYHRLVNRGLEVGVT